MMLNERLSRALDLTDEQDARIREILEARRANSARVLEEIQPRLQAELDSIRIEIRAILTPAQAERFDEFMRREEEMFTRRMPRPDSVGPPHR
jgi:Spy/CpxP family protein refolding chaperone